MAEIPVEKKSSMAWLWLLLLAILAALLIWWLVADDDDDAEMAHSIDAAETAAVDPDAEVNADIGSVTLAAISADAQSYFGNEFSGEVSVGGPLTDRGFWVESEGARVFALIIDEPREVPLDINAGQQLRISSARIREGGEVSDVEGVPLDNDTRQILSGQDVFLIVDEENIEIIERP